MNLVCAVFFIAFFVASGAAPVGARPSFREERMKTFDQRQHGTTNIQAHLDNIVVILVPGNRLSITDFAAKTEPESPQHKPPPAINKLLQQLSEVKSAPSSIEAQPTELLNSIPEPEKDAHTSVRLAQMGSIPLLQNQEESQAEAKEDAKPKAQSDGAAKKMPFQIDSNPLEIPVLVIQDP